MWSCGDDTERHPAGQDKPDDAATERGNQGVGGALAGADYARLPVLRQSADLAARAQSPRLRGIANTLMVFEIP